jgi:hypothetical protein
MWLLFAPFQLTGACFHEAPGLRRESCLILTEMGVEDLAITAAKTNVDSHRFHERHGFTQGFVIYHGKGSPGRCSQGGRRGYSGDGERPQPGRKRQQP